MTSPSPHAARVRRSGRRLLIGVRAAFVLLFLVPVAVLALCGWTDWQHVGPDAISGTSTSTRCRYGDADSVIACYGTFVSDDGSLTLHDVEIRLEVSEDGHTGPATASRTSHRWVVLGTSHGRVVTLLLRQAMGVSLVWLVAYGGLVMALMVVAVAWTGRQVGRAIGGAAGGPRAPGRGT